MRKRLNVATCRRYLSALQAQKALKAAGVEAVIVTRHGVQVDPVDAPRAAEVLREILKRDREGANVR